MYRFLNAATVRGLVTMGALFLVMTSCLGAPAQATAGHGLALLPGGQVAGWGANEFGQVQADQGDFVAAPLRLQLPDVKLVAVAAGGRHSLALDTAGKVWAWGDNSSGQLGLGHTRPVAGLSMVSGLAARALAVAAGAQHSAALLADGSVWVWGANNRGQLGNGVTAVFAVEPHPVPVAGLADVLALAAGDDFVVVLVGKRSKGGAVKGVVWRWGAGKDLPHPVDGVQSVAALRAAGDVVMARSSAGRYWRWGVDPLPPTVASRQAFERLGEMTHPMLGALAALARAGTPPRLSKVGAPKVDVPKVAVAQPMAPAERAVVVAAAPVAAVVLAPTATAPTPATMPAPTLPIPMTTPVSPATAPAASTAPVRVSVSGTVRLSDAPLEHVQVAAEGAQCSSTDHQGRYVCHVAAGWSGRVSPSRNNYRFSPSALTFRNLRVDAGQQDFAAIYDPR